MTKISNLYALTSYLTADLVNNRIGINTASPTTLLDVNGTLRASGAATFASSVTATTATLSGSASDRLIMTRTSVGTYHLAISSDDRFAIYDPSADAERISITSGGNVGIGTTTPVGGAGATDRTLSVNSGTGAASFVTGLVNGTRFSTLFTSSSSVVLETNAAIPLAFNTNSTERMRITSGGNVGIGTTDATHRLVLQNGTSEVGIRLTDGTNNTYFAHAASNGNFANGSIAGDAVVRGSNGISLAPNNGGSTTLRIASTGAATFSNNITASGFIYTNGNLAAANGNQTANSVSATLFLGNRGFFSSPDVGVATIQALSTGTFWYSGTALTFSTNPGPDVTGTNPVERMRITSSGNMLIATTSDIGGRLQVNGDIRAYGSFFRETGNITVNNGWTNVFTINTASQRTYLLQIIATNSEASLSYRYFGVIQGNPASSSYTSVSLASQTMEVQLSGATIQTRLTNSNQFNFNWSITQLL